MTTTNRRRILVDMDGILVNLIDPWLHAYNAKTGESITREDITTFGIHNHVRRKELIYKIPKRPGFWRNLPPIDGAVEGFHKIISYGHDVVVCTSPYDEHSAMDKYQWCNEHLGIDHRQVIMMHKKSLLAPGVDAIIDDRPETIREFALAGKEVVTIAHPYTESVRHLCDGYYSHWDDLADHFNPRTEAAIEEEE